MCRSAIGPEDPAAVALRGAWVAEKPKNPAQAGAVAPGGGAAPAKPVTKAGPAERATRPDWRTSWQLPALVGAVVLLAGGVVTALVTAPKPDFKKMLAQATTLIEHEDYDTALDYLNQKVRPYYDLQDLNPEQGRLFHILRGRAVYLGEKKLGIENEQNAESVVEEYTDALVGGGGPLEPRDQYFLADAHVSLGKYDRALKLAADMPQTERELRGRVLKRVVERQLAAPALDADATLKLLAEFLKENELSASDRAWALGRQAELLLRQGMAERAIAKLVQTMPALVQECPPDALAELYMLLGRAYWDAGAVSDAARQLEQANRLLLETDQRRAEVLVLLAKIDELTKQPPDEARNEARLKYTAAIEKFGDAAAVLPALLGLGELFAAQGDFDASLQAYADLVKDLGSGRRHPDVRPESVVASLMDRFNGRYDTGDMENALRFATLAEKLFPPGAVAPEVLLAVARTERRSAEAKLREGAGRDLQELSRLDPATREQARLELIAAGQYFRRHAERVGISDNDAYGQSVWMAADSFDRAGDQDQAIPFFADFVKYFPGDPRQAEARFRLGQAYEAKGDYGMAAEYYRGLKEDSTRAGGTAGPFGDASYVPLAQTLLVDGDPANDTEAEQLLEQVVRGVVGDPTTPQFRAALIELAAVKRRRGDYTGAIQHLEEAVRRFPRAREIDQLRYDLADSYRQDARAMLKSLDEGMPDQRKQALREARIVRLNKAMELFDQVRRSLEGQDQRRLSRLEQLELRNSYFYLGDCAFELRDFEGAIRHYDSARERYPKDPASLVAMMQIVNAYLELGDAKRAETANNRAKAFYASLPASVWADPELPIDKDDWQRWLDAMSRLRPAGASASAPEKAEGGSEH